MLALPSLLVRGFYCLGRALVPGVVWPVDDQTSESVWLWCPDGSSPCFEPIPLFCIHQCSNLFTKNSRLLLSPDLLSLDLLDPAKTIEVEGNYWRRRVLEAMHIHCRQQTSNLDCGLAINPSWLPVLNQPSPPKYYYSHLITTLQHSCHHHSLN